MSLLLSLVLILISDFKLLNHPLNLLQLAMILRVTTFDPLWFLHKRLKPSRIVITHQKVKKEATSPKEVSTIWPSHLILLPTKDPTSSLLPPKISLLPI